MNIFTNVFGEHGLLAVGWMRHFVPNAFECIVRIRAVLGVTYFLAEYRRDTRP